MLYHVSNIHIKTPILFTQFSSITNVTLYDYSDNFLSFKLIDDLTISLTSSFKYYIDISGAYYLVDNQVNVKKNQFKYALLSTCGIFDALRHICWCHILIEICCEL